MNYTETIEYLYTQLPMFSRIGAAAYKVDLHNTIALCQALGNPETKFKTIHVAGTNGKGSVSHMLAAILQHCGYRTGLYTSPHIKHFGERIRINGEMIKEQYVIDFVKRTKDLTHSIQPSFFELTVAMAFEYFAAEQVDIAVIETGLGGKLDSTNVISPILSVITNIGYDHMNILGNTLPEIAAQKAGIIKKNTAVVIGEILPETRIVFETKANEMNAPVLLAQSRFITEFLEPTGGLLFCNVKDTETNTVENLRLDLNGIYQGKNICTLLAAVAELKKLGYEIPETKMREALEQVKQLTGMRGRWDVIAEKPTVVIDVAHNADGIAQVLKQLAWEYPTAGWHFVLGFVNDKDLANTLAKLPSQSHYYFTNAHIPRAMPHKDLQQLAESFGLNGNSFDDVNEAIQAAKAAAQEKDIIVVCGSFFIAAEVND